MKRTEVVDTIAAALDMKKCDVKKVLDTFYGVVVNSLISGDEVNITGFGKFYLSERAERVGRNPQTGEEIMIPACKSPKFKFGKSIRNGLK